MSALGSSPTVTGVRAPISPSTSILSGGSVITRTSLLVFVKDQPGALYRVLEPFARHGLSMTRIESRPGHAGPWQYAFFIDIEGHVQEPAMERALEALADFAQEVRVLGSYPVAIE